MNYNDLLEIQKAARFSRKAGNLKDQIPSIRKAFNYSKSAGENEMALHFSRLLQNYYLVLEQDLQRGEFYQDEAEAAQYLLNIEVEVDLKYSYFAYYINRSRSLPYEIEAELKLFVREYAPYIDINNFGINVNLYPIIIAYYYKSGDTQKAIDTCQKAISYFNSIKSNKVYVFYLMLVPSLIINKQHAEAQEAINEAKARIIGKSYNLSSILFYETINLLHWGKYEEALTRTMEATKNKQINPALTEQWQIVKAFLQVLSNSGLVSKTNFRVSKLLKDMPIFKKDRAGNYTHILILKTISAIQNDKDLMVKEQIKVEKAARKYFKEGSRSDIFMNMLLQIPEQYFQYEEIIGHTESDLQALKQLPLTTDPLEVIPYEALWEICMNYIKEHQLVYVK